MSDAGESRIATGKLPNSSALRFSTTDYSPADRVDAWREIYGRTLLKLDIEPIAAGPFHTDVLMRRMPGLGMIVGSRSAALYRRPRDRIDNDDLVMSFGVAGAFEATQFGRIASMDRDDAVVVSAGAPGHVLLPASGQSLTLSVPLRVISPAVRGLDTAYCRRIPADSAALRLLRRYVGILEEAATFADPDLQRHAVTHIHDLIALAIGATRDAAEVAGGRGVRAARLRAIKQDIAENIERAELSLDQIAMRHRVTPRYVRMLFEAEGTSFTDYVLGQRLARAHRLLTDPRFAIEKISTIAFDTGFGDLSYFNRTFRRHYGAAPSDVRAAARREGAT